MTRPNMFKWIALFFAVAAVPFILVVIGSIENEQEEKALRSGVEQIDVPDDHNKVLQKFMEIKTKALDAPVREGFEPVLIAKNVQVAAARNIIGDWGGMGIARYKDGQVQWVVTAGHVFSKPNTYYIQLLRRTLPDRTVWAVTKADVGINNQAKEVVDRALVNVGTDPVPLPQLWTIGKNFRSKAAPPLPEDRINVTSSVTGITYPVVAIAQDIVYPNGSTQAPMYIVDYAPTEGESGTCYFGKEASDFFTFCAGTWITADQLKILSLSGPPRRMAMLNRWRLDKE